MARGLGLEAGKKIKLECSSTYGHHLRVSRNDASAIRNSNNSNSNFIELSTQKSGVLFQSPELRRLSDLIAETKDKFAQRQKSLVREVVRIAATYREVLLAVNAWLAQVDAVMALGRVAAEAATPWTRPRILPMDDPAGTLELIGSRHPCLEAILSSSSNTGQSTSIIPNDVSLGTDRTMNIVTGPNMGGKSTYIRQVALTTLLAQLGSYVPCTSATLTIRDGIYTRVGAADSTRRGVSTFMAEMVESAGVVRAATRGSLVVVDELGRGTSTVDGFGLAWAISQ